MGNTFWLGLKEIRSVLSDKVLVLSGRQERPASVVDLLQEMAVHHVWSEP